MSPHFQTPKSDQPQKWKSMKKTYFLAPNKEGYIMVLEIPGWQTSYWKLTSHIQQVMLRFQKPLQVQLQPPFQVIPQGPTFRQKYISRTLACFNTMFLLPIWIGNNDDTSLPLTKLMPTSFLGDTYNGFSCNNGRWMSMKLWILIKNPSHCLYNLKTKN